jgi:hypothetical protein
MFYLFPKNYCKQCLIQTSSVRLYTDSVNEEIGGNKKHADRVGIV